MNQTEPARSFLSPSSFGIAVINGAVIMTASIIWNQG